MKAPLLLTLTALGLIILTFSLNQAFLWPYLISQTALVLAVGLGFASIERPKVEGYRFWLAALAAMGPVEYLFTNPAVLGWPRWVALLAILPLLTVIGLSRRRIWTAAAGLLALLLEDLVVVGLLLPHPYPFPGVPGLQPNLLADWPLLTALWLQQILAGGTATSFLLAATSGGPTARRHLDRGLLYLAPQPIVGVILAQELRLHLTVIWAMLMGGGAAVMWLVSTLLTVSLVLLALLALATRSSGQRVGRWAAAVGTLVLLGALVWGGEAMIWSFTGHTLEAAAVTGLAGWIISYLPRGRQQHLLRWSLGGLGLAVLVTMTLAGGMGARPYLAKARILPPLPLSGPTGPAPGSRILRGRAVAAYLGCFTCHGLDGRADRPNPGAPLESVPAWNSPRFVKVFDAPRSPQRLKTLLWKGQYAFYRAYYPQRGNWSVMFHTRDDYANVPAWNGMMSPSQLDDLVTYLRSLAPSEGGSHG